MTRWIGAIGMALLVAACGGGTNPAPTPTPTPVPTAGACSVPIVPAVNAADAPPKADLGDDRRSRRGRVYEQLWKHQAAVAKRQSAAGAITADAIAEDIGQLAVIRDQGDLLLQPNGFDLRSIGIGFTRNGAGGYDARRSDRSFQSSVGDKLTLGDDDSVRVTLPFSFAFYAGRYGDLFVNSDGNVTFGVEDRASTARNVSRFLTGPPRIAPIFQDLDPSRGGGVYRRVDSDGVLVTWCDVPEYDNLANRVNVQLRLGADGSIDFLYGATVSASAAVVGLSPGSTGIFTPVDVSTVTAGPIGGGSGAIGERFSTDPDLDFVGLTQKFYQTHGDDFDQLVLYTNARSTPRGTFAFEFTVANEVAGIGVDIFDSSRDFGSRGRLRSIVDMDRLANYPNDPRTRFLGENNTLSLMGQECGHRWLAYLRFRDGTINSAELLGRDQAHWSFFFNSDASNMEGNEIQDLGGGAFRTVGAVSRYSALDQYAMGLRAASDVPAMFLVTGVTSGGSAGDSPRIGVDIRGTRKDLTIADIVTANGTRQPDASTAPKTFRQAFIYLVAGTPESSDDLGKLESIRGAWETYFSDSTEHRGTMISRLR